MNKKELIKLIEQVPILMTKYQQNGELSEQDTKMGMQILCTEDHISKSKLLKYPENVFEIDPKKLIELIKQL